MLEEQNRLLPQSGQADLRLVDATEALPESPPRGRLDRALRIEWLGQTIASLCWIISVFVYGISGVGDCLQLAAASAWLVANLAVLVVKEDAIHE